MIDWLTRIWSTVSGTVTSEVRAVLDWVWAFVTGFLAMLVDPAVLFDLAARLLSQFVNWFASFLPEDMQEAVQTAGSFLSDAPVRQGVAGALWFVSPIVTPSLLLGVALVMFYFSFACLVVRLGLYIKNHVWSSGS